MVISHGRLTQQLNPLADYFIWWYLKAQDFKWRSQTTDWLKEFIHELDFSSRVDNHLVNIIFKKKTKIAKQNGKYCSFLQYILD